MTHDPPRDRARPDHSAPVTRQYLYEVLARVERHLADTRRDARRRVETLEQKVDRMALQFDHILQALGTLEGNTSTLLSMLDEVREQLTDVTDRLNRVTAGEISHDDAAAEQTAAQAEIDALAGRIDTVATHQAEAIAAAKDTIPGGQDPAPTRPDVPGLPDAPIQPGSPAGAVTTPEVPVATPTTGGETTGVGGVSVEGLPAAPPRQDGTVITAPPAPEPVDPATVQMPAQPATTIVPPVEQPVTPAEPVAEPVVPQGGVVTSTDPSVAPLQNTPAA